MNKSDNAIKLVRINKSDNAIKSVRIALASLDPKTAPKFNKDQIEAERTKIKQGLQDALDLLTKELN
jgi:hypothetical protein